LDLQRYRVGRLTGLERLHGKTAIPDVNTCLMFVITFMPSVLKELEE
jgi:hypothetical protein